MRVTGHAHDGALIVCDVQVARMYFTSVNVCVHVRVETRYIGECRSVNKACSKACSAKPTVKPAELCLIGMASASTQQVNTGREYTVSDTDLRSPITSGACTHRLACSAVLTKRT